MSVEYPRQSMRIRTRIIRIRENYGYPQNIYPQIQSVISAHLW